MVDIPYSIKAPRKRKRFVAIGSSLADLRKMPPAVRDAVGGAIGFAQLGVYPADARPFGEGLPRGIHKIVEDHDGETYRAAFVIEFPEVVYLLDVIQKKSKKGRATPTSDLNRVRARYKVAREHYAMNFKDSTQQ